MIIGLYDIFDFCVVLKQLQLKVVNCDKKEIKCLDLILSSIINVCTISRQVPSFYYLRVSNYILK